MHFLKKEKIFRNTIILVLHQKDQEKWTKKRCREIQINYNLEKHQIIRKVAKDANFSDVEEMLKDSIEQMIKGNAINTSASNLVKKLKGLDNMETDSERSHFPQMAANSILKDIDEHNNAQEGSAKVQILPFQSDLKLRQQMAALDKELCRQRKLRENKTVQNYAFDITEEKWKLQVNELLKPISETFKYFIRCLRDFDSTDRKYFLQYLKMGLNERSIQQLQPLHEEFKKRQIEEESESRDRRLKEIDEQITHGSLGIEHFFREMAVVFDNITSLGRQSRHLSEFKDILDLLTETMAVVFKEGTAMEIMDGDAVNVPIEWLTSVLKKVESGGKATVYKASVLGAQSCGKSTLLNTVFGLNFPVSSGRCTRGAYMQLVKVDESLKETLKCDYVAVIDSEGLMSRSRAADTDYDNELSTFIIGLSDLTLVIIKGEGNEMQDVLPLAIHVFLRMNILGEHQAVHFVHQNMGAVDVMTKVATEIEAFVKDLNGKTLAAAQDVGQCDQYKKFTDILKYNPTEDNTYVPGLWDGALPMGKTNIQYSKTTQKLKLDVLRIFEGILKKKKPSSFSQMALRTNELWNAIKYENFVLSFKNVMAVEAHKRLTKIFDEERWTLKRELHEMLQQEKHIVENEVTMSQPAQASVVNHVETSKLKIQNHVVLRCAEIGKTILHYFQCSGCAECSSDVTGRQLLANKEKEFYDEVQSLKKTLMKEIDSIMDNLEVRLKIDARIHQLSTEMDDFLVNKVKETIQTKKSEGLESHDIEEMFESLWKEATYDVLRLTRYTYTHLNIEATVQTVVRNFFGSDDHFYLQMLTRESTRKKCGNTVFRVDRQRHMKLMRNWFYFGDIITDEDVHRLVIESGKIINQTRKYYDSTTHPEGKLFNKSEVEELFFDVLEQIHNIEDERFKTTHEYNVDLVHHIEAQAVAGFTEMHEKYCSHSSPEALLEKKRKSYHDLFISKMGQGNIANQFCENFLKDLILKNVDEQLSCTELLHDLRVHQAEMFRDIKSVQASIMMDLLKENQFQPYIEYITDYRTCMKKKMDKESKEHFIGEERLESLAKVKLDQVISTILRALQDTTETMCDGKDFMKSFFSQIENLQISQNEVGAYLELDVANPKQFSTIVGEQLQGPACEDMRKTISSWDTGKKLDEKGLEEFLFTELVGCSSRCPFCKVPCDAHSGGKTEGNHSAILHRPQGLGGYVCNETECLVSEDCCFSIASKDDFRSRDQENWVPYKKYQTVFPRWTIHGNADPRVEKYWKWVLAEHNTRFAGYYTSKGAALPVEWSRYTKEEIIQDTEDNYHITVDPRIFDSFKDLGNSQEDEQDL